MSNYFNNFRKTLYLFGDETSPVAFQDLSKYVDIIDKLADEISAYMTYEIKDFERPDTLSYRLYGKSEYDWTFFLMNDNIRERGWPLALQDIYKLATTDLYKDWTCILDISTADSAAKFAKIYPVGQEVLLNGKTLKVKSKNLQLGEISLYSPNYSEDSSFVGLQALSYSDGSNPVALANTVNEYNGTYHYIDDSSNSIDLYFSTSATKVPVTNLEHLIEENDELKTIRVIKKVNISNVVGRFKTLSGL